METSPYQHCDGGQRTLCICHDSLNYIPHRMNLAVGKFKNKCKTFKVNSTLTTKGQTEN